MLLVTFAGAALLIEASGGPRSWTAGVGVGLLVVGVAGFLATHSRRRTSVAATPIAVPVSTQETDVRPDDLMQRALDGWKAAVAGARDGLDNAIAARQTAIAGTQQELDLLRGSGHGRRLAGFAGAELYEKAIVVSGVEIGLVGTVARVSRVSGSDDVAITIDCKGKLTSFTCSRTDEKKARAFATQVTEAAIEAAYREHSRPARIAELEDRLARLTTDRSAIEAAERELLRLQSLPMSDGALADAGRTAAARSADPPATTDLDLPTGHG